MIVVWSLLGFLTVVIALLAVPLEWVFKVHQEQGQREASSQVRWLFGLVRVRTTEAKGEVKPKSKVLEPKKPGKADKSGRNHSPLAVIRVDGFVGRVITLIRRLLASIQIDYLNLQARLGLGDAADTGRLWAFIGPLSVLLAQPGATRVTIEPDFQQEVLDFTSDGRIKVVPLKVVSLALGFLLSRNTLRAWRAMKAGK